MEISDMTQWKKRALHLEQALVEAKLWHYSEDKALSKSGRGDADYYWMRSQHQEQLDTIEAALQKDFE